MNDTQKPNPIGSREVAALALRLATAATPDEENALKSDARAQGYTCSCVNFGGEFIPSINKIIERSIVSARREGVIGEAHLEEGAVAGAAREALSQIMNKAIGLNVGGKIAVVRHKDHIGVVMFFGIGMVHLNEIAVGLGHRAI